MKKNLTLFFLFVGLGLQAQNLSGFWVGTVMQNGRPNVFSYQLDLQQEGTTLTGKAVSITQDGSATAEFSIAGTWEGGGQLILQELVQVTPKGGGWCLKYASLRLGTTGDGVWVLQGGWLADNCSPGTMRLVKESDANQLDVGEDVFVPEGIWTGHLSQTDRAYEFYYELNLQPEGKGFSKIMSEENGGSARHLLTWKLNENRDSLIVEEQGVLEKTDPNWRWCIKKLAFGLDEDFNRFGYTGTWAGRIDATETQKAGACAPGKVYVEKPILNKDVKANIRSLQTQTSLGTQGRKLKLQRSIQVSSPELTISVWDNGTEDGDVITMFFNGHQLAKQHRISKNKSNYRVKLSSNENFLILQADDLGSIKPNTVAVSINDGQREQILVMSADFEENGAVLIRRIEK
ncbi:MAG TPA: hypothetical protein PLC89_15830 [Haliscomenobacter sp.]|uniref:hypothetical protein n=1 Tax=Haliscomenobacter sp. TaxID=2717303 RepID=UPI002D16F037|nr:hypothetical protein [Haliscomenobacter sp.]HOY18772.1 hypothetical protein [Haliscomenobacter sp.]